MKKALLAVAMAGLTLGAFGQGGVILDNNSAIGYVDYGSPGSHYDGPFGLELWMKNGTAADSAINSLNGMWGPLAYALLTADGFTLQKTFTGKTMAGGIFSGIGEVDMPGVDRSVNNGSAVLGLVIWAGNATSFLGSTHPGVLTFVNPTSDYTIPPPDTPLMPALFGMNQDLIMWAPEPGVFALAGLGAAVLLVFRRRIGCS